jgi:ankyrin repeat protein
MPNISLYNFCVQTLPPEKVSHLKGLVHKVEKTKQLPTDPINSSENLEEKPDLKSQLLRNLFQALYGDETTQAPLAKPSQDLIISNLIESGAQFFEKLKQESDEEAYSKMLDAYIEKFIIHEITDKDFKQQQRIARDTGRNVPVDNSLSREILLKHVQTDQKTRLKEWITYLTSADADYCDHFCKYWIFNSIVNLGTEYSADSSDEARKKIIFENRKLNSLVPLPELNQEALSGVVEIVKNYREKGADSFSETDPVIHKFFSDGNIPSFAKLYAHLINKVTKNNSDYDPKIVAGSWVKYPKKSNADKLVNALQGHNTGWCTASSIETAKAQLSRGDFYVYYSNDRDGDPVIPRIAIRLENDQIVEARGTAIRQNLDKYIAGSNILAEKLKEFPSASKYLKTTEDMKTLTQIDKKNQKGEELNLEDLAFIYEIDSPISSFGYSADPRISEILANRNLQQDLATILNISPNFIAMSEKDLTDNTLLYLTNIRNTDELRREIVSYLFKNRPDETLTNYSEIKAKISEVPNSQSYFAKLEGSKKIVAIYNKYFESADQKKSAEVPIDEDALILVHGLSSTLGIFDADKGKLETIKKSRDLRTDLAQIFDVDVSLVALRKDEVNTETKVYYAPNKQRHPFYELAKETDNYSALLKEMLKNPILLNQLDDRGNNALQSVIYDDHLCNRFSSDLIKAGVDLNNHNKEGFTVLLQSISQKTKKENLVDELIKAGVDVNVCHREDGYNPLSFAAQNQDLVLINKLIAAGANPDIRNKEGVTALMLAASHGFLQSVKELVKLGADLNITDKQGRTALNYAISQNQHEVVKFLLSQEELNINHKDNSGLSYLHSAVNRKQLDTVKSLLNLNIDINTKDNGGYTALSSAAYDGFDEAIEILYGAGANINLPNNDGFTPLMLAIQEGKIPTVMLLLLNLNADIHLLNNYKNSALGIAAKKGDLNIVKELIGANADLNIQNAEDWTPLSSSIKNGYSKVALELIKAGANTDIQVQGFTPLMLAIAENDYIVFQSLLESRANLNLMKKDGLTAFHYAIAEKNYQMAESLLEAGADVNINPNKDVHSLSQLIGAEEYDLAGKLINLGIKVDYVGENTYWSPLIKAIKQESMTMFDKLLKVEANPNYQDSNGTNSLMLAVLTQKPEFLEKLLTVGAIKLDLVDENNLTALGYAVSNGKDDRVKRLIDAGADIKAGKMNMFSLKSKAEKNPDLYGPIYTARLDAEA